MVCVRRRHDADARRGRGKAKFSRSFINGIYEIRYVREDGIWKILSINWVIPYGVESVTAGSCRKTSPAPCWREDREIRTPGLPDIVMDKNDLRYVTGYILPYHFKHPVTGKPTGESKRNARLKPIKA